MRGVETGSRGDHVAMFLPSLVGGGAERVALTLMQEFVDRGCAVDLVLVRRHGVLLPLVPEGVRIVDLGASTLRRSILPLARYLRRERPVALHAMMWPLPAIAVVARMMARVGTRIVGSEHITLSAAPYALRYAPVRALTRWAYLRADALIGVSKGVASDLAAFMGLPGDRIATIYNPLQLPAALPDGAEAASRWPAATRRILAVGTLKHQKNYPLLLRALAHVRQRLPVSLVILGEGGLRAELEAQAAEAGLGEAVVFAGFERDPWPYYAAADLFVLSSTFEGFGNVVVEALHAGLPVVSTDCPNGPREILADGEFGTLVACDDERALADAIETALRIPPDRASLRRRAAALSGEQAVDLHLAQMLGSSSSVRGIGRVRKGDRDRAVRVPIG